MWYGFGFFQMVFLRFNSIYYFKKKKNHCLSLTEHSSTMLFIYSFRNMIWNWLSAATATPVTLVVSEKKPLFVLFVALINLYYYSDAYIPLTYFLSSIISLNNIYAEFFVIIEKEGSLSFSFNQEYFLEHEVIVTVILTIVLHYSSFCISNIWFKHYFLLPLQVLSIKF